MNVVLFRHVSQKIKLYSTLIQYRTAIAQAQLHETQTHHHSQQPHELDPLKPPHLDHDRMTMHPRIGNREIVGYGMKGNPDYFDLAMFPCPSIRWEVDTPEVKKLREKEQGDWHNLTIEEKRKLYRSSFRQTFEEFTQPEGIWKWSFGWGLIAFAGLTFIYDGYRRLVYTFDPPDSTSDEKLKTQLQYHIAARQGPQTGLSSEWDYEVGTWKKNVGKDGKSIKPIKSREE
ncbi:unnamed protein product [Didymodactylos carnosus]|uniref:Cytochrome c oxidase subunit 4 n=1 Tax=Didymodactylos carnosus TaxID=1234261 RepID=A0A813SNN9_9BILA|nr:unnamed protein product [Didymodactylos carnosus]CAF3582499.1 unnamed protein product [Didymodactylos carnosus]